MAITDWYVNPASGTDDLAAGRGESDGDPWASVAYAVATGIPNTGRNTTEGDRINLKAGTADTSAPWSITTYVTTAIAPAPLVIEGYTTTRGDGGTASVDGGGSAPIIAAGFDGLVVINLSFTGWGAGWCIQADNNCTFLNCEFDFESARTYGLRLDAYGTIANCTFKNVSGNDQSLNVNGYGTVAENCYFQGASIGNMVQMSGSSTTIRGCIINASAAACTGIAIIGNNSTCRGNTVYNSAAGAASAGILIDGDSCKASNNYVEGWSGTAGIGLQVAPAEYANILHNNYFYNNTSNVTLSGSVIVQSGTTSLGSSALTNPGTSDFSVGADLKANAWPSEFAEISQSRFVDVGAVQRVEPTGSGSSGGRLVGASVLIG